MKGRKVKARMADGREELGGKGDVGSAALNNGRIHPYLA